MGFPKPAGLRKSCFLPLPTAIATAHCYHSLLLALAFFLLPFIANAQQPVAASPTSQQIEPDTTPLLFTFALAPERSYPAGDTLPDLGFRMYDPARRQLIDWGTLGNLGSSARPLLFETQPRRGFEVGEHAFDLYRLQPGDLRFYRNTRSFSDVFFSQGAKQEQSMFSARFARTFEGGANFSLDYRSINHLGQYRYQRNKHNALVFGVWLPVGKRYDGFLTFSKNVMRQQENGGIVSDTAFGEGQFSGPINAEIRLPDEQAFTRIADQTLQLTQHLKFTGAKDESKRALRATHTFAWKQEDYKFSDGNAQQGLRQDSSFFDTFLVDRRGIRHFTTLQRFDNAFTLSTFKTQTRGRPSDVLAVGLVHSYFNLNQEPRDSSFSNLFLTGDFSITPSDRFVLRAKGSFGLLSNFGEYQVGGEILLRLGKVGQISAGLLSQRRPPSLLHHQLFVSKRLLWQNDFEKPVENTLYATYALPLIGLELTARTHLINNYLFFSQAGIAAQTASPVQVAQFIIGENFNLGPVRFENTVALQQSTRSDLVRLPDWFTKNSIYFSGKIFRNRLRFNAGADFRLNSEFRPDGYQPVTWQFHLQDSLTQKPFPWLDVFLAFKVQSFRGFVRYENFLSLWNKTDVFYQTARYPQPFGGIRFGIAWRFMDSNRAEPGQTPVPASPPSGTIGPTGIRG
ncbi:MAG: hypothetical protein DYG98_00270 [Haliscomenobacteraceae bacterium CHB4]|nr:hypothetical protein [Saprospiraceae bacterium]MCE7921470.1 hypothetical protein [Haliscomenobacteraceae bacterium CHB4]